MKDEKKYLELAEKWLNGSITPEEKKIFSDWYGSEPDHDLTWDELTGSNRSELRKRIFNKIEKETGFKNVRGLRILQYAAAIALFCFGSVTTLYFLSKDKTVNQVLTPIIIPKDDITAPDLTKAVLTLADGTQIYIDSIQNGTLLPTTDNAEILKSNSGSLVYAAGSSLSEVSVLSSSPTYNKISVPRGSQIVNLTLSDGTKVWMNTESTLRFPILFTGDTRTVEVSGEVYFEVSRDIKRRFLVQCDDFETEVLGTSFNVNTHKDDGKNKITLFEGSVKVSKSQNNQSVILQPGQQAVVQSSITKHNKTNAKNAIAWRDGWFVFENSNIISITQELERWYDIDFHFDGDLSQKHFTGRISKNESTAEVLRMLELTDAISFKIEGKNVTISP